MSLSYAFARNPSLHSVWHFSNFQDDFNFHQTALVRRYYREFPYWVIE